MVDSQVTDALVEETAILEQILARNYRPLTQSSLEASACARLAARIRSHHDLYEPLLLATASLPRRWYDWNIGFIVPHLDHEQLCIVLVQNSNALAQSEGIAWGLGEAGSDDPRIIDFLFTVCETCRDYDAWWCAADALEKLEQADAVDLKKRTLRGVQWDDLDHCLEHLDQRPAVIGVLRLATLKTTETRIVPACRAALATLDRKRVQNAVWLLERLRVSDPLTLSMLYSLYEAAEDVSHTLRPRIVEALGEIATPAARALLEDALRNARYYRTRAYAARGLGRIGDTRSAATLTSALSDEEDQRVTGYISEALYAIKNPNKRNLYQATRDVRWPENGMITDQSNYWYGNPAIYDQFSNAEDPLALSLDYATAQIPEGTGTILDIGTGTGRLALHSYRSRPDIARIIALDISEPMLGYLHNEIRFSPGLRERLIPISGSTAQLPFSSCSVDAVISSWAFPSRIWNKPNTLNELREVRRVLRDGGLLITIGWDESFRDELSELWYRFVPEPDFRRESFEKWRARRRSKITSPRNCGLTFVKRNLRVPLLFDSPEASAQILGYLFGHSAGQWVARQQRLEFSISVGITRDDTEDLDRAIEALAAEVTDGIAGDRDAQE